MPFLPEDAVLEDAPANGPDFSEIDNDPSLSPETKRQLKDALLANPDAMKGAGGRIGPDGVLEVDIITNEPAGGTFLPLDTKLDEPASDPSLWDSANALVNMDRQLPGGRPRFTEDLARIGNADACLRGKIGGRECYFHVATFAYCKVSGKPKCLQSA